MPQKRDAKAWEKINREVEQSRSRQSLSAGDVPFQATRRLADIVADKHAPFSANLSVNEFLTSKSTGFKPIAQVSGTSMFKLGWQLPPLFSSGELEVITEAQSSLRTLALTRIQQEARLLNADGIVGVKTHETEHDWCRGLLQFTLVGTAIRLSGQPVSLNPFVSTLSGQEFWSLYEGGYMPVGYAYGNSTYFSLARMQAEASALQADGIIGPQVTKKLHGWGSHVLEYFAIGTAIVPTRADHTIPTPQMVLPLTDPFNK